MLWHGLGGRTDLENKNRGASRTTVSNALPLKLLAACLPRCRNTILASPSLCVMYGLFHELSGTIMNQGRLRFGRGITKEQSLKVVGCFVSTVVYAAMNRTRVDVLLLLPAPERSWLGLRYWEQFCNSLPCTHQPITVQLLLR